MTACVLPAALAVVPAPHARPETATPALPRHAGHARVLSWLTLLSCLFAGPAPAQVQRCTAADGTVVFTDRDCTSVGAEDWRQAPATGEATTAPANVGAQQCPRSARDLAAQVSAAIQSNDGNHLSALYDWMGVAPSQQAAVFARLDALARRPLAGLEPILAEAAAPASSATGTLSPGAATTPSEGTPADGMPANSTRQRVSTAVGTVTWAPAPANSAGLATPPAATVSAPGAPATLPAPRGAPAPRVVGIRVLQSAPDGIRAINTPLLLVRRWGCWWLRF